MRLLFLLVLTAVANWVVAQNEQLLLSTLSPTASPGQVCLFQKLELALELPASVKTQVQDFLTDRTGLNPFEPRDIDLEATFSGPDGITHVVHGFYMYDYQLRDATGDGKPDSFQRTETGTEWRIRTTFAVVGAWKGDIQLKVNGKSLATQSINIQVHDWGCTHPGRMVRTYEDNANDRYFRLSKSNEWFQPRGVNLAWDNRKENPWWETGPATLQFYTERMRQLSEATGNFIRVYAGGWSFSPNWEEVDNYATGNYLREPNSVRGPVNFPTFDRMEKMWVLDQIFEEATALTNPLYVMLCVEPHNHTNLNGQSWPPNVWETNPYRQLSGVTDPEDFFTDPEAIRYYKNRLRYTMARWGYSPALGIFELFSELDGAIVIEEEEKIKRPYQSKSDYGTQLRTKTNGWVAEMARYLKHDLGYSQLPITVGYAIGEDQNIEERVWATPEVDLVSIHFYGKGRYVNQRERWEMLRNLGKHPLTQHKPIFLAEVGADIKAPLDRVSTLNYHNTLWATALMGCFGPGVQWHLTPFYEEEHHAEFAAMQAYFENEQLTRGKFTASVSARGKWVSYQLVDSAQQRALGWLHNSTFYASRLYELDTAVKRAIDIHYSNSHARDLRIPKPSTGAPAMLKGFKSGHRYRISFWSTQGKGGHLKQWDQEVVCVRGKLRCIAPYSGKLTPPYREDFGYKVEQLAAKPKALSSLLGPIGRLKKIKKRAKTLSTNW